MGVIHLFLNGTSSVSGIVFYNCTSEGDYSTSEGHRRWSQGLLYDNVTFSKSQTNRLLGLYNRGSFGTGHGWSTTHSVAWSVQVPLPGKILLQKPPGRQNYAIGCHSLVTNINTFTHPLGYVELTNQFLQIPSLYIKQLETRLKQGISPDAPVHLKAEIQEGKIVLHWLDIASQEIGYGIELSTNEGISFTEIAQTQADQTSYEFPAMSSSNNLTFRVFALGAHCPSPYSNQVQIDLITDNKSIRFDEMKIFPNPFSDVIHIQSKMQNHTVRVLDLSGREVIRKKAISKLSTSELSGNLYFLQITDDYGRTYIIKMLKQ